MPDHLTDALGQLTRARDQLIAASQIAAGAGSWEAALSLMKLAERADQLRADVPASGDGGRSKGDRAAAHGANGHAEAPRLSDRESYPKFVVREDSLVKRGLQRDRRRVYEHSVPRERYEATVEHLAGMAARGQGKHRPFTLEHVQDDLDHPRYVTYVVASFLLKTGLIKRVRKGSYDFSGPETFAADAADLWCRLESSVLTQVPRG